MAVLEEHLNHRPAHQAGGTDDGDAEGSSLGHRGMAPQGFEVIRARRRV
jgi:hypothetical protein